MRGGIGTRMRKVRSKEGNGWLDRAVVVRGERRVKRSDNWRGVMRSASGVMGWASTGMSTTTKLLFSQKIYCFRWFSMLLIGFSV